MARQGYAAARRRRKNNSRKKLIIVLVVLLVVVVILGTAGFFGYRILDAYRERNGMNRTDEIITVTVSDTDTVESVVQKLADSGVVKYEDKLMDYLRVQGTSFTLNTGDLQFYRYAGYPDIYGIIKKASSRQTVTIRFREGDEVSDFVALFIENGIGTQEEFDQVLDTYDFGYDYIPEPGTPNRLEGFLYPDTYEFYQDTTPQAALQKLVDEFDAKISETDIQAGLADSDLSFYEVLTLASIVQKEAGTAADMPKVASVFLNRLDIDMKLRSDACYSYRLPKEERSYSLTAEQIQTDDPYNTYMYEGLTPTPISNPTITAIRAVLYPEQTDYLYFCYVGNGVTKFAKTYDEHMVNVREFRNWYQSQAGEE